MYPFSKLVYGDEQVGISSGCLLERSNQIKPLDRKGPHDGDHLECLGLEVSLPSVVLTPFAGAHDLLGVGYYGRPIEALSKHIFDQGPRCGMVPADPIVDITQQLLPLFNGDATL